jgi:hypothetical protein
MLSVKLRRRLKTTYKNSTFFDFLFLGLYLRLNLASILCLVELTRYGFCRCFCLLEGLFKKSHGLSPDSKLVGDYLLYAQMRV